MNDSSIDIRHILVPTDYSSASIRALQYGLRLGALHRAKVTIVHVDDQVLHAPAHCNVVELIKSHAEEKVMKIQKLNQFLKPHLESVKNSRALRLDTFVLDGEPSKQIVKFAAEKEVDMIVIATSGLSGIARWMMGGTSRSVVDHARCPVLVVRENEHEFIQVES